MNPRVESNMMCASYNGIATHYIDSSSLPDLEARLGELNFRDTATLPERLSIINSTISEFETGLPHDVPMQLSGLIRQAIDAIFSPTQSPTISEILSALETYASHSSAPATVQAWARKTRQTIQERSPTSVLVALRQMRAGGNWSIAETFQREHRIAARFMAHADFVEGVSARLMRKPPDTPQWQPDRFEDVAPPTIDEFFHFPEAGERLQLLNAGSGADYETYPHRWIGLPRERDVEARVREAKSDREEVLRYFVQENRGKQGVRERVSEILERKTKLGADGSLEWSA